MGATLERDERGIWILRISGALRKEEMDAVQAMGIAGMGSGENARVLVVVGADFLGWLGDEVWGDMTFFVEHGDRIEKMAIVGDPKWETHMLMFAGAGFRRAPVRYFATERMSEAYSWLA